MSRHLRFWPVRLLVATLSLLALASLTWGSYHALSKSADLERRVTEVKLLVQRVNPYVEPDSTYPPSALPVFALAIGPLLVSPTLIRAVGLLLNLLALAVIARELLRDHLAAWPRVWLWVFLLVILACKPVRLTLGMGQFSLIPLACMLVALRAAESAPARRWSAHGTCARETDAEPALSDSAGFSWPPESRRVRNWPPPGVAGCRLRLVRSRPPPVNARLEASRQQSVRRRPDRPPLGLGPPLAAIRPAKLNSHYGRLRWRRAV